MKLADSIRWIVVIAGCFVLGLAARAAVAARPAAGVDPARELQRADIKALRRAIEDLAATFGDRYPRGKDLLKQAADCEKEASAFESALRTGNTKIGPNASALAAKIEALRREALLANPLLDFDKLLLVRRREDRMGLPQNWQGNCFACPQPATTTRSPCSRRSARAASSPPFFSPRKPRSWATWTCTSTPRKCSSRCPTPTTAGRSMNWASTAAASAR